MGDVRAEIVLAMHILHERPPFLISIKKGKSEWALLGLTGVEDLPAVKWKLMNNKRMEKKKHKKALEKLRNYLEK